ncbi:MAG: ribonuclease HI [Rickettsiaceae bacterium]|nr:ribonuclease HI [Rickettsiaceae bacterium]
MVAKKQQKSVSIYTDGACSGNPGPGGWGVYMIYGEHKKHLMGHSLETTNNRMELTAAIEGIKALKEKCSVDLYTDSTYVKNGITQWIEKWIVNNWRTSNKTLVKNADLWQDLYEKVNQHDISWHWVKGHATDIGNNIADSLATRGRDEAIKILGIKNNTTEIL